MKIKQSVLLVALSGIMLSACNSGGGTSSSAGATAQSAALASNNPSANSSTTANTATTGTIAGLSNKSMKISTTAEGIFDSIAEELAGEAVDAAGLGGLGQLGVQTFFSTILGGGSSAAPNYTPELNQILKATAAIQNQISQMQAQMNQAFGNQYQLTLAAWQTTSGVFQINAVNNMDDQNQTVALAYNNILSLMTPVEESAFQTSGYTQAMENDLFSEQKYMDLYYILTSSSNAGLFQSILGEISGSKIQSGQWVANNNGDYQTILTTAYSHEASQYPVILPGTRGGSYAPVTKNSFNNPNFVNKPGNNMFAAVYDFDNFALGLYTNQFNI